MKSFNYDKEEVDKRAYLKVLMQMKEENRTLKEENSKMKKEKREIGKGSRPKGKEEEERRKQDQIENERQKQIQKERRRQKRELLDKISVSVMDISMDLKNEQDALEVTFIQHKSEETAENTQQDPKSQTNTKREKLERYLANKRKRKRQKRMNQSAYVRRGPSESISGISQWSQKKKKRALEENDVLSGVSSAGKSNNSNQKAKDKSPVSGGYKEETGISQSAFREIGAGEDLDISMQSNISRFDEMRMRKKEKEFENKTEQIKNKRQLNGEQEGNEVAVIPKRENAISQDLELMSRSLVSQKGQDMRQVENKRLESEILKNQDLYKRIGMYEEEVVELNLKVERALVREERAILENENLKEVIIRLESELANEKFGKLDRSVNQGNLILGFQYS